MELDYEKLLHFFILSFLSTFLAIFLIDDKNRKLKISLFSISIVFYSLQAISFLTIMWDINYHFLANLFDYTNYTVAFTTYREYTWLAVIVIILLIVAVYFMNKYIKIKNNKIRYLITAFCCIFLTTPFSLINRFSIVLYKILYNPSYTKNHKELFKEITGEDFVDVKDIKIEETKNKNLVLIFLESFEQNFLDDNLLKDVAPNLRLLTKQGEFFSNIEQIEGSSWTMAGIHTVLCGTPEIYSVRRNKLFKTVTISNLSCFSDVLKKLNYNQTYIGGEFKTFAGKSYFLELHGYNEVYGDKEIFQRLDVLEDNKWSWGAKDHEVFEFAKIKYIELSKENKPFNLTISTLAPHAPSGIYDSRCRNTTDNSTLNAVQCNDDLLSDFIKFLKDQPNYNNTIIVLLPDHLLMASNASEILNNIGNRKLYSLFLNTNNVIVYNNKILYTDIARLILDRIGVVSNIKFLLENRGEKTTSERVNFINSNIEKIRSFNNKSILQE